MVRIVNICDVCSEIFAGGDAPKNNMSQTPNERHSIPIFSNGEENEGLYGYTDNPRVTKPSITVSARGTIGYTAIRNSPFVPIVRLITLTPNPELIDIKYLYYAVQNYKFDGSGTSIPQLTVPSIKKYSFQLPTMEEQKRIALLLDNLCELIEKRKKQSNKLDELVKSRFVELFGDIHKPSKWEKRPWSELVTIQNGRDYKNILVESGGYPVYGTGGEMARASEYLCPENTIIVGRKGTINNPLLVKEKFWNVDTAFGVIVGNRLHYQYFYNFCRMFDFSTLNKQAVLPSTTKADLLKIKIAVPPMEMQNQFANFVKEVDKSKFEVQQSLEKLETLKNSLMQQYFG